MPISRGEQPWNVRRTGMTTEVSSVLTQLGLSQYLAAFVDEGFDTWEALLDIQESDLSVQY